MRQVLFSELELNLAGHGGPCLLDFVFKLNVGVVFFLHLSVFLCVFSLPLLLDFEHLLSLDLADSFANCLVIFRLL